LPARLVIARAGGRAILPGNLARSRLSARSRLLKDIAAYPKWCASSSSLVARRAMKTGWHPDAPIASHVLSYSAKLLKVINNQQTTAGSLLAAVLSYVLRRRRILSPLGRGHFHVIPPRPSPEIDMKATKCNVMQHAIGMERKRQAGIVHYQTKPSALLICYTRAVTLLL